MQGAETLCSKYVMHRQLPGRRRRPLVKLSYCRSNYTPGQQPFTDHAPHALDHPVSQGNGLPIIASSLAACCWKLKHIGILADADHAETRSLKPLCSMYCDLHGLTWKKSTSAFSMDEERTRSVHFADGFSTVFGRPLGRTLGMICRLSGMHVLWLNGTS